MSTSPSLVRNGLTGLACVALGLSILPTAHADDLTDERDRIKSEQAAAASNVENFSAELNQAAENLQRSEAQLSQAREALAQAQTARRQAQAEDARLAASLREARAKLAAARKAVADNQKAVDAEARLIGASVRETHQQNTELMGIAAFVSEVSTGDVNQKMQWSHTIFNATQAQMDRLQALQLKLEAAKQARTRAEAEVSAQRDEAAAQLQRTRSAEAQADQAAASVQQLVGANAQARDAVTGKLADEKKRQAGLDGEARAVQQRIEARIAAQKAAAAKAAAEARAKAQAEARAQAAAAARARAEADRLAREARIAQQRRQADAAAKIARARRAQAAAQQAVSQARSSESRQRTVQAPSPSYSGGGFLAPVNGPLTSPFGQRFHPVLHYWKLHDGMDYGAACGAPIRAARSGVVSEAYYNGGYGNRLMIDHGMVNGSYVTTGYNHATHYVVSVGQRVQQGQVIGYVGNTGYSTGCHLHLMIWKNGQLMNPSSYF